MSRAIRSNLAGARDSSWAANLLWAATLSLAITACTGGPPEPPRAAAAPASPRPPAPAAISTEKQELAGSSAELSAPTADVGAPAATAPTIDDDGCGASLMSGELSRKPAASAKVIACTAVAERLYQLGEERIAADKIDHAVEAWRAAAGATLPDEAAVRLARMRLGEISAVVKEPRALCHFAAALSPRVWCHPSLNKALTTLVGDAGCVAVLTCEAATPPGVVQADAVDKAALGCLRALLSVRPLSVDGKSLENPDARLTNVAAYAAKRCDVVR